MKNFFFKTIGTAAIATVMLAGKLSAQGGGGSKGYPYAPESRYDNGRDYRDERFHEVRRGAAGNREFEMFERRRELREREWEIERELRSVFLPRFRRIELIREEHRIHEALARMPQVRGYRY